MSGKKHLTKFLKPDLKYYELKYCCIHGGQAFKAKGKEDRGVPRKLIDIKWFSMPVGMIVDVSYVEHWNKTA